MGNEILIVAAVAGPPPLDRIRRRNAARIEPVWRPATASEDE